MYHSVFDFGTFHTNFTLMYAVCSMLTKLCSTYVVDFVFGWMDATVLFFLRRTCVEKAPFFLSFHKPSLSA